MKHKYPALLLTLALLLCLGGCTQTQSHTEPSETGTPEPFGVSNLDAAPEPMAGITAQPEPSASEPEPTAYVAPAPDEQALISALLSEYEAGLSYDPTSTLYFWRAVSFLAGHTGEVSDGQVQFTGAELSAYVAALFGPDVEGYTTPGEENPWVTEDFLNGESVYTVTTTGPFNYSVRKSDPEPQEDGSYVLHVELMQTQGPQSLADYTVTLVDFPADREGTEQFSYCITGISRG